MTGRGVGALTSDATRHPIRRTVGAIALSLLMVLAVVGLGEGLRFAGDAIQRPHVDAFYTDPAEIDGEPGSLVRSQPLLGVPPGSRGWRILYRSVDAQGAPVLVSGLVVEPLWPAAPGTRELVSWGHPTTGTAPGCAPSRAFDPTLFMEGLRMLLSTGRAVVGTDYPGMGVDGPDSYLVGETSGRAMLDAARAARTLLDASDRVVLWGHSQGGQAALFAGQLAPTYAPDLDIRAVAVAAPAADLTSLMSAHLDDISGVTIGSYAFPAYADTYGPSVPGADLDAILTPAAVAAAPAMNELCLLTQTDELHTIGAPLVGDFVVSDPTTTEPWASLLKENSAGAVAIDAPLFVAQGAKDELVLPEDTAQFVAAERALGMTVDEVVIPGATHGTIAYEAIPALALWLAEID